MSYEGDYEYVLQSFATMHKANGTKNQINAQPSFLDSLNNNTKPCEYLLCTLLHNKGLHPKFQWPHIVMLFTK